MEENGRENAKVGEHPAVIVFELEAYPEPKILSSKEIQEFLKTIRIEIWPKPWGVALVSYVTGVTKAKPTDFIRFFNAFQKE